MGWGSRIRKKVKSYSKRIGGKAKKYAGKAIDISKKAMSMDPMVGGYMNKGDFKMPKGSEGQKYKMADVARSRAAGSGVINYTDQEMRPE